MSEISQVKNDEFVCAKCLILLQLLIALITRSAVNVCAISIGLFYTLVCSCGLVERVVISKLKGPGFIQLV